MRIVKKDGAAYRAAIADNMNVNTWIMIANIAYLASYAVHDILWLRVLTIVGALLLIPYYYLQQAPLWPAIGWNAVFIAINLFWIVRLVLERRPVHLTPDERRLRELSFPSLTGREVRDLFQAGIWENVSPGASMVEHDRASGRLSVILNGTADVVLQGAKVAELAEGQFVGEVDSHADKIDVDVVVRTPMRIMCWDRSQLLTFLKDRPDVRLALERSIGLQLRQSLDAAMTQLRDKSEP